MDNSTVAMDEFKNQTSLDKWNSELARALLSNTVLLVLYLLVGVIGNSLVIIVYTRLRNESEERFFIPYLAVIDIVACVLCSTFGIIVNQYAVTFTNDGACKAFWLFKLIITGCSIFTLLLIAVHRYQKICRPFKEQMSLRRKKLCLVIVVAASTFVSLPALVFYGTSPVRHPEQNIMGTRCANIRGPWSKTVAVVYKAVIMVVCLCVLISLVVLYSLIGRAVFKSIKLNKKRKASIAISSDSSTAYSGPVSEDSKKLSSRRMSNVASRTLNIPGYRLSMMFTFITVVFVICYIPTLVMMVVESRNEMFWLTQDISSYGGYRNVYTLYIINSIINPVIYGFFDKKFRRELSSLC